VSATGINDAGVITGSYYSGANFISHGFLRGTHGGITIFDVPGSVSTSADSINRLGTISGCYTDANSLSHGFLRASDGTMTTFDPPGSTGACNNYAYYAPPTSHISAEGEVAGAYFLPIPGNPFGGNPRGFVRASDGTFTTFDAGTYPPCCDWTFATAINARGEVVGYLNDGYNANHGFLRRTNGTIITLDAPGASVGGGGNICNGTLANDINAAGQITGQYFDSSNAGHGYLWIP
jgi:probable HAF family extracellular repeat protein